MKLKKSPPQSNDVKLILGDCLDVMKVIPDKSIDMILCDLPYGVTKNVWDKPIPFAPLWEHYNRIIKDNGAIILFGQGMFTANLMLSNKKMWRYNLVWNKVLSTGFLNSNLMPLRVHEDICVFYKKRTTYNPQKVKGKPCHSRGRAVNKNSAELKNDNYGDYTILNTEGDMKHPTSILTFSKPHSSVSKYSAEKPVELLEFLIKSYSNEGDIVLDNCMGSGSTGVACINTKRRFIGIDKNEIAYSKSKERLNVK